MHSNKKCYKQPNTSKFPSDFDLSINFNKRNDYSELGYVGWEESERDQPGYRLFFSNENIGYIQNEIRKQLMSFGHNILVTKDVITNVMSSIFQNRTPVIGDMYTYYNIPQKEIRDDVQNNTERVINTIVSYILDEEDMKKWNYSLNLWDTVYGDFNRKGLRAHPIIKKRDKDYMKGQMNFNY